MPVAVDSVHYLQVGSQKSLHDRLCPAPELRICPYCRLHHASPANQAKLHPEGLSPKLLDPANSARSDRSSWLLS